MNRALLLESTAARAGDYRTGEVPAITPTRVDQWLNQFPSDVQLPVLAEVDHVLSRSYVRRSAFESFFAEVVIDPKLVENDPAAFWGPARFFNQQKLGQSQAAMLKMFDSALQNACGRSVFGTGDAGGRLVYVDDAVYSGMHMINDLKQVIPEAAKHTEICLVFYAVHNQGVAYAMGELTKGFRAAGKTVNFSGLARLNLENKTATNSDILWPKVVPDHEQTKQYLASLPRSFEFRTGDQVGKNSFFSSGAARHLLEQEFLKAGSVIRSENGNLNKFARPLGNRVMVSFGFGALIVTYRNCANNCPLVFWAGAEPLFHRNNN